MKHLLDISFLESKVKNFAVESGLMIASTSWSFEEMYETAKQPMEI